MRGCLRVEVRLFLMLCYLDQHRYGCTKYGAPAEEVGRGRRKVGGEAKGQVWL